MSQSAQLNDRASGEVLPGSPLLILAAMGELVGEQRAVAFATIGQDHVVSQRHRATSACAEHESPKPPGPPPASRLVEPHA